MTSDEPEYIPREAERLAQQLCDTAQLIEPAVTAQMQSLALANGATLTGLENKLKHVKSLSGKLTKTAQMWVKDQKKDHGVEVSKQGAWRAVVNAHCTAPHGDKHLNVMDVLRYTFLIPGDKYTAAVSAIRARLAQAGHTPLDQKNFWGYLGTYRGINDSYAFDASTTGANPALLLPNRLFTYELQFHTPE